MSAPSIKRRRLELGEAIHSLRKAWQADCNLEEVEALVSGPSLTDQAVEVEMFSVLDWLWDFEDDCFLFNCFKVLKKIVLFLFNVLKGFGPPCEGSCSQDTVWGRVGPRVWSSHSFDPMVPRRRAPRNCPFQEWMPYFCFWYCWSLPSTRARLWFALEPWVASRAQRTSSSH